MSTCMCTYIHIYSVHVYTYVHTYTNIHKCLCDKHIYANSYITDTCLYVYKTTESLEAVTP